jgi:pyrroline-5-carboxylate reductase
LINQYFELRVGLTKGEHLIASCHPDDKASLAAFQKFGAKSITQNVSVVENSDVLFLSVKPNVVSTVLTEVRHVSSNKLFVSIAMGVTTNYIEQVKIHFHWRLEYEMIHEIFIRIF